MAKQEQDDKAIKVFKAWRNAPEERTNVLDDFLFWYEYENLYDVYATKEEDKITQDKIKAMRELFAEFQGIEDEKLIAKGEKALLERWNKSVLG